ncbi:MAG: hypothetical protein KUG79_15705 [Pseudomonadales bacterium]|nr:hypothetical protein [Pseudomonadales bacterium]
MVRETGTKEGRKGATWDTWLQEILAGLLSAHFIIAAMIIIFWFTALSGQLDILKEIQLNLVGKNSADIDAAKSLIGEVTDTAIIVSGLFTTVLGLVLGHYFGQKGQQVSDKARHYAEQGRAQLADKVSDEEDMVVEQLAGLTEALEMSNDAVTQLVDILDSEIEGGLEGIELEPNSPIMRMIADNAD